MKEVEIYIDGAAKGNPGPAAVGAVFFENNSQVKTISRFIGNATNNIAEYTALIYALQEALILNAKNLKIFTDSELLYKQFKGEYKVKNPKIWQLFNQAKHMFRGFNNIEIKHINREKNKIADKLANEAIKNSGVDRLPSL